MELEDLELREISQAQKDGCYMFLFPQECKIKAFREQFRVVITVSLKYGLVVSVF